MRLIIKRNILECKAVVTISANPSVLSGSGATGIIHQAVRPQLKKTTKPLGPIKPR